MSHNVVVFEGATLDEARTKLFREAPRGVYLQKTIERTPLAKLVTAVGDSTEAAFAAALAQQPERMLVTHKREVASAYHGTLTVTAWDKVEAGALAQKQSGANTAVESVVERQPAKTGFLGFGKAAGRYEVSVRRKASVEVRFGSAAAIEATFGARLMTWEGSSTIC